MAEQTARKTVSGAEWAKAAGHTQVGVTLSPAEHRGLASVAGKCGDLGLSKAELSRRLIRWAIHKALSAKGLEEIKKIARSHDKSLDSRESGD